MRIAVTYDEGKVFQHFGRTETFALYDVEGGEIKKSIISAPENGHSALAGFLASLGVDALICGGMGMGARNALAEAGITVYGGVEGDADEAVKAFLKGALAYDPSAACSHHGHGEAGHSCGEHHCGGHDCSHK